MRTTRRVVLGLIPAALVAGCSSGDGVRGDDGATASGPGEPSRVAPAPQVSSASPSPVPSLDLVEPWREPAGEAHLVIKRAATQAVESLGSWSLAGDGLPGPARDRGASLGLTAAGADTFASLFDSEAVAATVEVVYPQLGGLTRDQASVMTVVHQRLLTPDGTLVERGHVLDVRLDLRGAAWVVRGAVPTPPLGSGDAPVSEVAQRVLDHPRLVLPHPAAADIRSGRVHDSILTVLSGLADEHDLQIQVFYDGHPTNVFGTDRPSRHSQGRAVDLVRVDGVMVTDPALPRETLETVMTLAGRLGATEVGGPFDLNGTGRGYFTDAVHLDHLHVAVGPGVPPAMP